MNNMKTDEVLDAKGLACPMPIVRTKKAMDAMKSGQVLEIQATDKGSTADLQAWAKRSGNQYLGTVEEGTTLFHYVRKSSSEEAIEKSYPNVVNNDELKKIIQEKNDVVLIDVREAAEYAFDHISHAQSIPLGELDHRMNKLSKEDEIYVICRTGNRSDMASKVLVENGFKHVKNVVPGMITWIKEEK
ncbi:sulfurtransferase TusA family protein [Pseudogracilibacillus auburnensis]|uniref:sulfurtransferase TusA family protein n=1 Tax=Pseudogracilibacillus auburnensis TaxID=1494959 RepID=UPI001A967483|nr:sulfurtransferase TusA family protein [Pseudogracilibacillus auburnensis]MBO1003982.1 sulfurtransferase TusA family protein [Pseudogracilibacillus auburnensis]